MTARVSTWWLPVSMVGAVACAGEAPERAGQTATGAVTSETVRGSDRLLLAAARVALPPPGVQPGELPDPASNGARAVVEFCSTCHNLPVPTLHSATDWPGVVRRMWLRMDRLSPDLRVAVPSVAQRHWILDYLVTNALQVSGTALPAGPGRETFSIACSRCHALPDPLQHSPADWPTVVSRMEQRMTQMNVDVPQPDEMGQILTYLSAVSARAPRR